MPFFLIKYIPGIFTFLWYFVVVLILFPVFYFFTKLKIIYFLTKLLFPDHFSVLEEKLDTNILNILAVLIFSFTIAYILFFFFKRLIKKYLQKILCRNLNSISIPQKFIEENSPLQPPCGPSNKLLFWLSFDTSFRQYFFQYTIGQFHIFSIKEIQPHNLKTGYFKEIDPNSKSLLLFCPEELKEN